MPQNLKQMRQRVPILALCLSYMGSLNDMVQDFRRAVVQYARDNEAKLKETYGENEVKKLIEYYGDMESPEWTGTIVWECAAHIYKRPIVVYGSPAAQGVPFFSGDKDGEIRPSAIFSPDGEPAGPPINLMQWDVHYCFLERKDSI